MADLLMSDVGCRMSDVGCRMSDVGCRMSEYLLETQVKNFISYLLLLASYF